MRTRTILVSALLAATAVAWLVVRYAPPSQGRLLFGGVRAGDLVVAMALVWTALAVLALGRSKRALARWILASVMFGVAWGIGELGWRMVPSRAEYWVGGFPTPNVDEHGVTTPDISYFWGVPGEPMPYHYQTNAWGYRNPPGRNSADVYCVGDSVLLAIHHNWEHIVPGLLEKSLERPVANISLIDKSPQEMQARFRLLNLDLQGKVVLQFLCEDNDLYDSHHFRQKGEIGQPVVVPRESLTNLAVLALQRLTQPVVAEAAQRRGTFAGEPCWFLYGRTYEPQYLAEVEPILASLAEFHAHVTAGGGRFAVVLVPAKLRIMGPHCEFPADSALLPLADKLSPLPQALQDWSRRSGVAVLDPSESLTALASRGVAPWFANETHLTQAGLAAIGDALARWSWWRE